MAEGRSGGPPEHSRASRQSCGGPLEGCSTTSQQREATQGHRMVRGRHGRAEGSSRGPPEGGSTVSWQSRGQQQRATGGFEGDSTGRATEGFEGGITASRQRAAVEGDGDSVGPEKTGDSMCEVRWRQRGFRLQSLREEGSRAEE